MVAVATLVLLASYVSLGRLLSSNLSYWQEDILAQLNAHLPFRVDASRLQGGWHSFTPQIALHDLQLTLPGEAGTTLELVGGRVGIDVLESLASRSLRVTALQLEALELQAEVTEDGRLLLPGLTDGGGEMGDWLEEFLLNIESLRLRDNTLSLHFPNGERRLMRLDATLSREGSRRWLSAKLVSDHGTRLRLSGNGLGNPFLPASFVGEAYAEVEVEALEATRAVLPEPPEHWPAGSVKARLWLDWQRGEPLLDLQVDARQLALSTGADSWSAPLEQLTLEGQLSGAPGAWQVFLEEGRLRRKGAEAVIPRMQVELKQDRLRLRTAAWQLQPLHALLSGASLPEQWAGVLDTLAPSGRVDALAFDAALEDGKLQRDWRLTGNFSELSLASWHGAPGVENAAGFFRLHADGGNVALDSENVSMAFPTVYEEALHYGSIEARVDLGWDSEAVTLHSGPVNAVGEEGQVNALFGLRIPLQESDTGIEMELLAGLRDSHPRYRDKYLPKILHAGLREWLSDAVGDGRLNEAGFIWRGSLRAHAAPLRTIQVMANLENASLRYQQDWPALEDLSATLLVDDVNVSVWSEHARLYDSQLQGISAEAWMDAAGDMRLVVNAALEGTLQDGLSTVGNSPLRAMTGGAFRDWRGSGTLDAHLGLGLNLNRSAAEPEVDFRGTVADGGISINPGGLSLEGLSGEFSYRSGQGFSSRGLAASLWGKPLAIEVSQGASLDPEEGGSGGQVAVDVSGSLQASDLQQWLGLKVLELASGEADFSARIAVQQGLAPRLSLGSSLEGVALDLPAPWSKIEPEISAFTLGMPLGGDERVVELRLGPALSLEIGLTPAGDGVGAVALGVGRSPPVLESGRIVVSGEAPLLDLEDWQAFSERYLLAAGEAGEAATEVEASSAAVPLGNALALDIQDMQVGRLLLWGSEYRDIRFSFASGQETMVADFEAPWGAGAYRAVPGEPGALQFDWIDPARLPTSPVATGISGESGPPAELPDLAPTDVAVQRLLWKGRELGDLRFRLQGKAGRFRAANIAGELAGLRISTQRAAQLVFTQGGKTRLTALFEYDDLGDTLIALGYARPLETRSGNLDLGIEWSGSPQDFSLASLDGYFDIHASDGRFLETPGGTGALKVVEILNLAGVVQRLSLSHVFESGIAFDSLDGQVFFHPGTIELANLTVIGSSSAFAMSGVSDVASRSLDGELVATLPVAGNLPWVAALAGGLPVAAGVFVVSKVFEKQVNRLSSGVYTIEGTWNEPEFAFDRIFDDELRRANAPRPTGTVLADPNQIPELAVLIADPNQVNGPPPALVDPNDIPGDELPRAGGGTEPRLPPDPNQPSP